MCGIVGYIGQREAVSFLLPALRRLEYRGYDSSGVATVDRARLDVRKAVGKIATLEALMAGSGYPGGTVGIAHTRWATHGRPSGAYALVCIAENTPDQLVAVRRGGSPLVIGFGKGETFVASDIPALVRETRDVVVLEDGDMAVVTRDDTALRRLDGASVRRKRAT